MADDFPLSSFSLTHVYYDPDDPISHICAGLSLIPQALFVVYFSLLVSTREVEIMLTFAGQLGNEVLNFALKRLIKERRPALFLDPAPSGTDQPYIHRGYGMPSSHAQYMGYWSMAISLFLLYRYRPRPDDPHAWPMAERRLALILLFGLTGLVAWSRVYLGYHSVRQVVVGLAAGLATATVWFWITGWMRQSGLLAYVLDLAPMRRGRVRDLLCEMDPSNAAWELWEKRRKVKGG